MSNGVLFSLNHVTLARISHQAAENTNKVLLGVEKLEQS